MPIRNGAFVVGTTAAKYVRHLVGLGLTYSDVAKRYTYCMYEKLHRTSNKFVGLSLVKEAELVLGQKAETWKDKAYVD